MTYLNYDTPALSGVLAEIHSEVVDEHGRQALPYGGQDHPDNLNAEIDYERSGQLLQQAAALNANPDTRTWLGLLLEEVYAASAERDPAARRRCVLQVAAIAAGWLAAMDRRTTPTAVRLPDNVSPQLLAELLNRAAGQAQTVPGHDTATAPVPEALAERPLCGHTAELPDSESTVACVKTAGHPGKWHRNGTTSWKSVIVFGVHSGHRSRPRTTAPTSDQLLADSERLGQEQRPLNHECGMPADVHEFVPEHVPPGESEPATCWLCGHHRTASCHPFPPNGGHQSNCAYVGGIGPLCTCT